MRKIAMLVANDIFPEDSSIPPLRFTQNDASTLKEVLEDQETCGMFLKEWGSLAAGALNPARPLTQAQAPPCQESGKQAV